MRVKSTSEVVSRTRTAALKCMMLTILSNHPALAAPVPIQPSHTVSKLIRSDLVAFVELRKMPDRMDRSWLVTTV